MRMMLNISQQGLGSVSKLILWCRYLLPPIIFYAGISVKKKQFFRNFASIATFGVLGTYIAFAVIACVLYGFSKLPNVLNFSVRMTYQL